MQKKKRKTNNSLAVLLGGGYETLIYMVSAISPRDSGEFHCGQLVTASFNPVEPFSSVVFWGTKSVQF